MEYSWEELEPILPASTITTESGSKLGCYLTLLNLTAGVRQCFEEYEKITAETNRSELESKIAFLLGKGGWGWRTHLPVAAYLLIIGVSDETRRALWDTIDRGSWVSPQLTVVAYLKDERFTDMARERIEAAALGQAFTSAKALSSLLYLCKRIRSTVSWLDDLERKKPLRTYLMENDHDRGYRFAEGWLFFLEERTGLSITDPGGRTTFDLCRAGDLYKLLDCLSEKQISMLTDWAMAVALRKVGDVVSRHYHNEQLLDGIESVKDWLSTGHSPEEAVLQAVEEAFVQVCPPRLLEIGKDYAFTSKNGVKRGTQGQLAYAAACAVYHLLKAPEADSAEKRLIVSVLPSLELSVAASGVVKEENFVEALSHYVHAPSEYIQKLVVRMLCRGAYVISE